MDALHERLREIDPSAAETIHKNNVRRVVRAIEIYLLTGKTKTEHDRLAISNSPYNSVIIALDYADREILYSRINSRVDAMISAGLENEVRELYASGCLYPDTTAGQAIGYKEMLDYIRGIDTLEVAVEKIKLGTRRYAIGCIRTSSEILKALSARRKSLSKNKGGESDGRRRKA